MLANEGGARLTNSICPSSPIGMRRLSQKENRVGSNPTGGTSIRRCSVMVSTFKNGYSELNTDSKLLLFSMSRKRIGFESRQRRQFRMHSAKLYSRQNFWEAVQLAHRV